MKQDLVKKAVLEYIKDHPGTSYVNIESLFDELGFEWKGDYMSTLPGYPSVVLWGGWNQEALAVISDLLNEKLIERVATHIVVYMVDGKGLTLPIARTLRHYKTPRWMPIVYKVV